MGKRGQRASFSWFGERSDASRGAEGCDSGCYRPREVHCRGPGVITRGYPTLNSKEVYQNGLRLVKGNFVSACRAGG